jgi:peptidoglycan/LPS O-acetylase OafA/YrhL
MRKSARHLDFIDYLRGIAILSVFLFHSLAASYGFSSFSWERLFRSFSAPVSFITLFPLHMAWIGVPIFFVVSGFCIHMSFQQQGREWDSFFIRRFFRLYPAYLAALFLFMLVYPNKNHDLWAQFTSHALLIHNYNSLTYYGLNASFWTIAIEVQLYLLYPLLLALVAKFGWRSTLFFLATCECFIHGWDAVYQSILGVSGYDYPVIFQKLLPFYNYVDTPSLAGLNASPLAFWFSWSLGAVAADAYLKKQPMPLAKSPVGLWVLMVVAAYLVRPLSPFFFLLSAVLTTTVISKYLGGSPAEGGTPNFLLGQLRRIGIYSYSIYLLHQPLLEMLGKSLTHFFPGMPPLIKFFCCISFWVVVMPLAAIWYRFIEVPGVALGKKVIQKIADRKNLRENCSVPS